MSNTIISLRGVTKKYRLYKAPSDRLREALSPFGKIYHTNYNALDNITFEVRENDIVGVVGKNGSGKSTLLKLIAGVLRPSEGDLVVTEPVTPLLELGAGLNPEYTGLENIYFYGSVLGIEKKRLEEVLEEIIDFADIGEYISQPFKTYSSGMKARLGFAIAVNIDPKILIVDEILAVGDIAFQRKCYRKMEELFMKGSTVLYVSHNMQSVIQLCNRAILLHQGKVLMDGSPESVVKAYRKLLYEGSLGEQELSDTSGDQSDTSRDSTVTDKIHPTLYVEGLNSKPYAMNDAITSFSEVHVIDNAGMRVNQLNQGETYTVSFLSCFHQSVRDVSFGCQILTLQGLIVTGANMLDNQDILYPHAATGEVVHVSCKFRCMLVPGTYVLKVFSTPEDGTPASVLEDAAMIEVRPQKRANGGYVFMEQDIYAKKSFTR